MRMSAVIKRREKKPQATLMVGLVRKPWLCVHKKKLTGETKYKRNLQKYMP